MASAWFSIEYQMLFAAAALLVSYIIPGHMLNLKYRNEKNEMQHESKATVDRQV